jgi:predicted ATPase
MITRVQALYYKGLKYIDVTLTPFLLLVGPNASGKSTFLDIFTLLRDILVKQPRGAIEERSSDFKELVWKKEKGYFELALEFLSQKEINGKFDRARYEISLSADKKEGIIVRNENLYLIKEGPNNDKTKPKEPLQRTLFPVEPQPPDHIVTERKWTPPGWRKIISKSPQGNDYFRSETTEWNITYRFGPKKASLASIPEDDLRFPITLWIKKILTEGIQFLQLNSVAMRKPCRPDAPVSLQMDGSNLPKVIKNLQKEHEKYFNLWIEHIRTAIPEIENIEVKERPEDRYLYIYAQHKGKFFIPSWLLSDGTLRLLAQTLIAYLPVKDHLYIIEEPENGLHPLAIESVFQSLSSVYENQVLLATHSPAILRLAEPKNILCFSKTESGAIDITHGEEHPKLRDWRKGIDLATLHASGVLQ